MPAHKSSTLAASVDSLPSPKEKEKSTAKRGGKPKSKATAININPTHQFMEAIKASAESQTFHNEDFPTPPPNKYKYSRQEILDMWAEHPLPSGTLVLPETTKEENLPPVAKDTALLKDFQEALHGQGKWIQLQSPLRTSRTTRGRGRSSKSSTRGRSDLMTSTDSARRSSKEDKSRGWGITQSASDIPTEGDAVKPPPTVKSQAAKPERLLSTDSEVLWQYIDDREQVEGPYKTSLMEHWYSKGYLPANLRVKRTTDKDFVVLSQMPLKDGSPFQASSLQSIPSSSSFGNKSSGRGESMSLRSSTSELRGSTDGLSGSSSQVPTATAPPAAAQPNPASSFSFASLWGLTPEQVGPSSTDQDPSAAAAAAGFGMNESLLSSGSLGWGAPEPSKVWNLDQIEGQWGSGSAAQPQPRPMAAAPSPWRNTSDTKQPISLKDIQEQQLTEQRVRPAPAQNPLMTSAEAQPEAQTPFAHWGFTSNEDVPVVSNGGGAAAALFGSGNSLRSSQNQQPTSWNAEPLPSASFQEIQQEENRKRQAAMRQHQQQARQNEQDSLRSSGSFWGNVPSSPSASSLHAIQQEEENQRRIKQQMMFEEHRQQQQERAKVEAPWSASPTGYNPQQLSLKEIQQLQMEESRRQQERAQRNAREMADAQQTAMWASQQNSSRPLSFLEIQQEELRRKERQERAKAAQMQQNKISNSSIWGSVWGSGAATSFTQIQEQQAQLSRPDPQAPTVGAPSGTSSVADVWAKGSDPTPSAGVPPSSKWANDDEDTLLWDPVAAKAQAQPKQPAPKPRKEAKDEFPSLRGSASSPNTKANALTRKSRDNVPNTAAPAKEEPKPKQQPAPEPARPADNGKGKAQRKKKKMKKVDASEFFSFGPGSLAGRDIEGPDY